jgi:hypothetical protein
MAKQTPAGGEKSKVRMLYVEGEFAPGEIQSLAMTFARPIPVRPSQPKRIAGGSATGNGALDVEREIEIEGPDEEETVEEQTQPSRPARASGAARVYRTPERLDLDLSAFAPFAKAKNPADDFPTHHLVAAFWFKEHFGTPNVTVDHAYSAYMAAGWSTKTKDFDQPFRMLKKKGLVKRVEPGVYTITLPGMGEVREMGKPVEREVSKPVATDASA